MAIRAPDGANNDSDKKIIIIDSWSEAVVKMVQCGAPYRLLLP